MTFQDKIYQLRAEKNLSQEKLAEDLSVSRQTVAKWETGKAYPEIEKIILISKYFGISIDNLLKNSGCGDTSIITHKNGCSCKQLIEFLLLAKRNTYAANSPKQHPSRPESQDWHFEKPPYKYMDSYVGAEKFSGQEIVYENGLAVWSMNYFGRVLDADFPGEFLKEALLSGTYENPYRGPLVYTKGDYTYHNVVNGTFECYTGHEEIFYKDKKVYDCNYIGGLLA